MKTFLYRLKNFLWGLRVFNSPFKRPKLKFYFGKIKHGTPYFLPRRWVKSKSGSGKVSKPVWFFKFDIIELGYKEKYGSWRFEWHPMISIVFLGLQFCVWIVPVHRGHYWESWLTYELSTDKSLSIQERLKQCRRENPNVWTQGKGKNKVKIDYLALSLKEKFVYLVK